MCDGCRCTCCDHGCTCGTKTSESSTAKKVLLTSGFAAGAGVSAFLVAKKLGLLDDFLG